MIVVISIKPPKYVVTLIYTGNNGLNIHSRSHACTQWKRTAYVCMKHSDMNRHMHTTTQNDTHAHTHVRTQQCNSANCYPVFFSPFAEAAIYCLSWNKKHIWSLSNHSAYLWDCVCIIVVYIAKKWSLYLCEVWGCAFTFPASHIGIL